MHFLLYVILPDDFYIDGIKQNLTTILAPFDERIEVSSYKDKEGELTTYNPKSKWDWWQVGGRWYGIIQENEQQRNDLYELDKNPTTIADNTSVCNKLIKTKNIPYALMLPNYTEWHEQDDFSKKEDWENIVLKLYEKYKDNYIVAVDYHI